MLLSTVTWLIVVITVPATTIYPPAEAIIVGRAIGEAKIAPPAATKAKPTILIIRKKFGACIYFAPLFLGEMSANRLTEGSVQF